MARLTGIDKAWICGDPHLMVGYCNSCGAEVVFCECDEYEYCPFCGKHFDTREEDDRDE